MVRLRKKSSISEQISEVAEKEIVEKKVKIKTRRLLSSGSTLLNLALTNNPFGAFLKGYYYWMVGDSDTGKTFLSITCCAEALLNPNFSHYSFIHDNVEDGMLIDLDSLFNPQLSERVSPPKRKRDGTPVYSSSIEDFYYNVDDAIQKSKETGIPFIYILDSMDSLTSKAADEKFAEQKKAHRSGKEVSGSYGDGKAKKNSENLRNIIRGVKETNSILIIISQTRDNISGTGFNSKTVSGGRSMKFYATTQIWSYPGGSIKKTVNGKSRQIGICVIVKTKKNRITGQKHEFNIHIYPSVGIDDVGDCVDFLVSEKWWAKDKNKNKINAEEFDVSMGREKLISYIEENGLYRDLQKITGRCWKNIQKACRVNRKNRYAVEE